LKLFNIATERSVYGVYRLLILDGFSSHIEYDFVDYARRNFIVLFGLPPHTTHFLQPLDVVCFQPLKHYHAEAIDAAVRTGDTTFSKTEFLAAFETFRKQAFKRDTILSAFRKTGIVPFDPSKVLTPLQNRVDAEYKALGIEGYNTMLEEMEPEDEEDGPVTPTGVKELHQFGTEILEELPDALKLSPTLALRIRKYIKGATIRIEFGAQTEEDLQHTQAAEAARAARNKTTQRRVLGGGIISVKEARTRIKDRAEDEAATEAKRAEKRQKRAKKQSDDTTATASTRGRQNQHQFEQIIEF
jgi:DDE superfamily endonuclease